MVVNNEINSHLSKDIFSDYNSVSLDEFCVIMKNLVLEYEGHFVFYTSDEKNYDKYCFIIKLPNFNNFLLKKENLCINHGISSILKEIENYFIFEFLLNIVDVMNIDNKIRNYLSKFSFIDVNCSSINLVEFNKIIEILISKYGGSFLFKIDGERKKDIYTFVLILKVNNNEKLIRIDIDSISKGIACILSELEQRSIYP